jgi:hypothetical protein
VAQLHFYVPDELEAQIRAKAERAHLSVSRYLADLVKREISQVATWPEGYAELFEKWEGEPLTREPQGEFERRLSIE